MRSIHRYATDGMILTMILHLIRHFAYDRYRGFRAFLVDHRRRPAHPSTPPASTVSCWSGINSRSSSSSRSPEWFDVLPMFNGTVIRNFLYEGSVNSRLFTLLAFFHIGAPLIVVFIMWCMCSACRARTSTRRCRSATR